MMTMTWWKDVLKAHPPTTTKWLEHCILDELLLQLFSNNMKMDLNL